MLAPPAPPSPSSVRTSVDHDARSARFQSIILSNLDAGHNLAWWLTRDAHEAADVVQEACLKAWRFFSSYRGGDAKSWFLAIVRTTVLSRKRDQRRELPLDDAQESDARTNSTPPPPIERLMQAADAEAVNRAIEISEGWHPWADHIENLNKLSNPILSFSINSTNEIMYF